jgi:uncharacterized protein GlcG (DUF336 family)
MLKRLLIACASLALLSANAWAQASQSYENPPQPCGIPNHIVEKVQGQLNSVISSGNGGLFTPNNMWSAIVDRKGVLCSVINTGTPPASDPWPGSRSIAIAKASTANDFSNDHLALSTANLYGLTQPGGSLYGLNNSNPFNPRFQPQGTSIGFVPGGIITFGGGVALYQNGKVIGGLGVSGDTACADHAIAFKMRHNAYLGLDIVPAGVAPKTSSNPNGTDNILYAACSTVTKPATPLTPACIASIANTNQHPHCAMTDITP